MNLDQIDCAMQNVVYYSVIEKTHMRSSSLCTSTPAIKDKSPKIMKVDNHPLLFEAEIELYKTKIPPTISPEATTWVWLFRPLFMRLKSHSQQYSPFINCLCHDVVRPIAFARVPNIHKLFSFPDVLVNRSPPLILLMVNCYPNNYLANLQFHTE